MKAEIFLYEAPAAQCQDIVLQALYGFILNDRVYYDSREEAECRYCQDHFGFDLRPILFGNLNAKTMQINQMPSLSVHKTGNPFMTQTESGRVRNDLKYLMKLSITRIIFLSYPSHTVIQAKLPAVIKNHQNAAPASG